MQYFPDDVKVDLTPHKLAFENRFITLTFENVRQKRQASSPVFEQRINASDTPETITKELIRHDNKEPKLFPSGLPVEAMLILADYVLAPSTEKKIQVEDDVCLQVANMVYQQANSFNDKFAGKGIMSGLRATVEDSAHKQMREGDMKAIEIAFNAILAKLSSQSPNKT